MLGLVSYLMILKVLRIFVSKEKLLRIAIEENVLTQIENLES
jgi:hypothetical protein